MAVAAGLSVAGNYFARPLLGLLRSELAMSTTTAGLTIAMARVGYALGLGLLVPLGDRYSRRGLAAVLLAATGVLLAVAGASPNGSLLLTATGLAAVTSVGAQVLVPFAAEISAPDRRARSHRARRPHRRDRPPLHAAGRVLRRPRVLAPSSSPGCSRPPRGGS
ncbi:hypothetical protein ACFWTE_11325 [Nocardiopsis sp. NPDC058631]|uniref:hypothetical protein n=1 Tax=Nocardiopsis sp. NPDC058631 TaxID=3346566 RepID=UPI0036472A61